MLKSILVRRTSGKASEGVESGGIEGVKRRYARGGALQGLPFRRAVGPPERECASSSTAMYLGEEDACFPEEARSGGARRGGQRLCRVTVASVIVSEADPAPAVTGASASALGD